MTVPCPTFCRCRVHRFLGCFFLTSGLNPEFAISFAQGLYGLLLQGLARDQHE